MLRLIAILAPLSVLSLQASAADDMIVDGKHCNSLCQAWLGIGAAPRMKDASPPPDKAARVERIPAAPPAAALAPGEMPYDSSALDSGPPQPSALVAVRGGDIMVATPAEAAFRKRQLTALQKEIDKSAPDSGDATDHRK